MAAVLERTLPPTSTNGVKTRLITVAEYDRMIEAGVYTADDRLELLNGKFIEVMPKGAKHAYFNEAVADFFKQKLGKKAVVRSQNPVVLDDFSEPEPDIVVCRPPREKYLAKHPAPEDILLIAEISDSTLYLDRNDKALAYARAGIKQYLIFNLNQETIEDYREPNEDGYGAKQTHRQGDAFSLAAFPEILLEVSKIK